MIKSMTGFSQVQSDSDMGRLSIEIKTVNSRYLDIFFKIPDFIRPFENCLRKLLYKKISRGKVECSIKLYKEPVDSLYIDNDYIDKVVGISKKLAKSYSIDNVGVGDLLRLPGVLVEKKTDLKELKDWLLPLFENAIDKLIEQRQSEGEHLSLLINGRLQNVSDIILDVSNNYSDSCNNIGNKLYEKLNLLAERYKTEIDDIRFEQEVIYLMSKMDIAEEIDRINGHILEVSKLLLLSKPVGRKLDFLMQEMNRESNTIASKSQNLGVTLNSVDLKVLIEQMREQIQNIE